VSVATLYTEYGHTRRHTESRRCSCRAFGRVLLLFTLILGVPDLAASKALGRIFLLVALHGLRPSPCKIARLRPRAASAGARAHPKVYRNGRPNQVYGAPRHPGRGSHTPSLVVQHSHTLYCPLQGSRSASALAYQPTSPWREEGWWKAAPLLSPRRHRLGDTPLSQQPMLLAEKA
jgi:hypothetical protein